MVFMITSQYLQLYNYQGYGLKIEDHAERMAATFYYYCAQSKCISVNVNEQSEQPSIEQSKVNICHTEHCAIWSNLDTWGQTVPYRGSMQSQSQEFRDVEHVNCITLYEFQEAEESSLLHNQPFTWAVAEGQ